MKLEAGQEVELVAVMGYNKLPISLSDTKAVFVRQKRTGMMVVRSLINDREYTVHPMEIRECNPHLKK